MNKPQNQKEQFANILQRDFLVKLRAHYIPQAKFAQSVKKVILRQFMVVINNTVLQIFIVGINYPLTQPNATNILIIIHGILCEVAWLLRFVRRRSLFIDLLLYLAMTFTLLLLCLNLLQPRRSLIQTTIDCSRNSQSSSDNGAQSRDETSQCLAPLLAIDDLHRRDIIREEDTWNATTCVLTLLVTLGRIITSTKTTLVARHRVLVRLDCSIFASSIATEVHIVVATATSTLLLPAQWEV